jgi:SagB-type dehydrogenase family enzyme
LWAGQGLTGGDGKRTAPSAGALYPLTLYYADDVSLWRYEPEGHALVRVGAGDKRPELTAAALGQAPLKNAAAIIIVVARPAVTAAKYGDRAERYCMLEAGHVAQNILLTAAALGLGACPVGAFRDDGVLAALALNADFLPLYLIPVGRAYN